MSILTFLSRPKPVPLYEVVDSPKDGPFPKICQTEEALECTRIKVGKGT